MTEPNDEKIKNETFPNWISPSVWLAVSKPLSWFIILIGGLSLFNLIKNHFGFELFLGAEFIDAAYTYIRNIVALPIELITGLTLPAYMKNGIIIYLAMGRSFTLAFNAIKENLNIIEQSDLSITHNWYKAIYGPILQIFNAWGNWMHSISPTQIEWLFSLIANFIASLFWPPGILVLLMHPTVWTVTHFNSQASVITADGQMVDKATRDAHHGRNPFSMPKYTSYGRHGRQIPKDPEPNYSSYYNARIIVMSFLLAQVFIAAVLIAINEVGLIIA